MSRSMRFQSERERLVHQLVTLGDERNQFLDAFFPMQGKERTEINQLLSKYTRFIEARLAKPGENPHSAVLIGCNVEMLDLDYKETDRFTIVYPGEADPDQNLISFLSPIGKHLLMASIGDEIDIPTPSGSMRVRITGISFDETEGLPEGGATVGS